MEKTQTTSAQEAELASLSSIPSDANATRLDKREIYLLSPFPVIPCRYMLSVSDQSALTFSSFSPWNSPLGICGERSKRHLKSAPRNGE